MKVHKGKKALLRALLAGVLTIYRNLKRLPVDKRVARGQLLVGELFRDCCSDFQQTKSGEVVCISASGFGDDWPFPRRLFLRLTGYEVSLLFDLVNTVETLSRDGFASLLAIRQIIDRREVNTHFLEESDGAKRVILKPGDCPYYVSGGQCQIPLRGVACTCAGDGDPRCGFYGFSGETVTRHYCLTSAGVAVDDFYMEFICHGIVTPEDDYAQIESFFDFRWTQLSEFIRSLIVEYHYVFNQLDRVGICKQCDGIYLPLKKGAERGRFCTDGCKDIYRRQMLKGIINCQNKQRQFLQTRIDTIQGVDWSPDSTPRIDMGGVVPKTDRCRKCEELSRRGKVKGGQCPDLIGSTVCSEIVDIYKKAKIIARERRKGRQRSELGIDFEYEAPDV